MVQVAFVTSAEIARSVLEEPKADAYQDLQVSRPRLKLLLTRAWVTPTAAGLIVSETCAGYLFSTQRLTLHQLA